MIEFSQIMASDAVLPGQNKGDKFTRLENALAKRGISPPEWRYVRSESNDNRQGHVGTILIAVYGEK